jgi:hypothetical protein
LSTTSEWDPPFPYRLHGALHAAAWLGDRDRVLETVSKLAADPGRGRRVKGLRLFAEAAERALDGDMASAIELFEAATDLWQESATRLELTLLQATFARLVGLDRPEARAAADSALEWITTSGFGNFLVLFAEVLPPQEQQAAASG